MELENLFVLIRELSTIQKRQLTKYLSQKKRGLETILYKRISRCKQIGEAEERKIPGQEFQDSNVFAQYRRRLAESIIRIRVAPHAGSIPPIAFIKDAYLVNGNSIGFRLLREKMVQAKEEENFGALQSYYDLISDLAQYHNIKIDLPKEVWSEKKFREIRKNQFELREAIHRIRRSFTLPKLQERKNVAADIESKLPAELVTKTNQHLSLKVRSGIARLRGSIDASFILVERFIEAMKQWPEKYPVPIRAKEMRILAFDATHLNYRNIATKYLLEISSLPPLRNHDRNEILIARIMVGVNIAERYSSPAIGLDAYALLKQNIGLFSSRMSNILYFLSGLGFFYDSAFSQAIECVNSIYHLDSEGDDRVSWEPVFLQALCHFHLGTADIMDYFIQSLTTLAGKSEQKFLPVALSHFEKIVNAQVSKHAGMFQEAYTELLALIENPDEARAAELLPIHYWFEAKATSIPIRDIMEKHLCISKIETEVASNS